MTPRTKQDDEKALQWAIALHQGGRLSEARSIYEEILRSRPSHLNATFFLGLSYAQQNNLEAAARFFGKAAKINPAFVDAHFNCGLAFHSMGNLQKALECYNRTIKLKADHADALYNRGVLLNASGRYEEALQSLDRALSVKPNHAEAYSIRGVVLSALKRFEEALQSCDRAILLNPNYAEPYSNRGAALRELKRFEEALQSCDQAIRLKPIFAEAHTNRGIALNDLQRFEEALGSYERAIRLDPNSEFLMGIILNTKMKICDWRSYTSSVAEISDRILRAEKVIQPFPILALPSAPGLQRKASEIWVGAKYPENDEINKAPKLPRHKIIRIGYFSGDFHSHPVALLIAELIEMHDRSKFELIAFSFGPDKDDDMRVRLKGAFDKFIDIRNLSDRDAAMLARKFEIDICVDLSGFTGDARTNIFAMRAAPIQVNYLGYPGTMGADYIDYLIADPVLIPAAYQTHYKEKIAYLPNTYQPNDRKRRISDKSFTRAEVGLPPQGFVFCCFNNNYKITPDVFDSWMRILAHVEGSILWLRGDNEIAARNLKKEASARGVDPDRLVFAPRMPVPDHLARHRAADLFLDTLPYNAHTTASDALWAGLPVLTQSGETFAGRVAASLLNAVGLPELVTTTRDDYEALAIELATDPAKLASIKRKLADNRLTTPLFDTALFTRHIEAAYTAMYERHQAGLPPDHIRVPQ